MKHNLEHTVKYKIHIYFGNHHLHKNNTDPIYNISAYIRIEYSFSVETCNYKWYLEIR